MGSLDTSAKMPSIDISTLTTGSDADPDARKAVASDLLTKVINGGFIAIKGHGIPPSRLAEAFEMSRSFFQLSPEDKMKAPHPDAEVPHRGYMAIGREQGAAKTAYLEENPGKKEELSQTTDYKETYDIGSEGNLIHGNVWLPEQVLPGFRTFELDLFWELNKLAETILDALLVGLNVTDTERKKIQDLHPGHSNHLRLNHYPPSPNMAADDSSPIFSRLGPHSDWSTFTLLFQDDCGGLEFRDPKTQQFIPAVPAEGVLYMNVGDMFERFSNGICDSAYHRVVGYRGQRNEGRPSANIGRCSIVYFLVPHSDAVIEPVPSLVTPDRKKSCDPFKYSEYSEHLHSVINKY